MPKASPLYLSTAQMREADRRAIEEIGIPGAVLMNNAGAAVYKHVAGGSLGVVCGKGNNGGDGYVVARLALLDGLHTRVIVLAERESIHGDAATFLNAYEQLGGTVQFLTEEDTVRSAIARLTTCDKIIDAILGTGITGEVRGLALAAIESWPKDPITLAVDIPSGLNADTGKICGACIQAHKTITFQFPKIGFKESEAAPYLGELHIADIGIPAICADDAAWHARK